MKSQASPFAIGKVCEADWEKMRGNDKQRFCEHCQKYVHNLSAMTDRERAGFAVNTEQMCIAYLQRTDGRIANLSFLSFLRRWFPPLRLIGWSAFVAILPAILTGCMGVRVPKNAITPIPNNQTENKSQSSNAELNLKQSVTNSPSSKQ